MCRRHYTTDCKYMPRLPLKAKPMNGPRPVWRAVVGALCQCKCVRSSADWSLTIAASRSDLYWWGPGDSRPCPKDRAAYARCSWISGFATQATMLGLKLDFGEDRAMPISFTCSCQIEGQTPHGHAGCPFASDCSKSRAIQDQKRYDRVAAIYILAPG